MSRTQAFCIHRNSGHHRAHLLSPLLLTLQYSGIGRCYRAALSCVRLNLQEPHFYEEHEGTLWEWPVPSYSYTIFSFIHETQKSVVSKCQTAKTLICSESAHKFWHAARTVLNAAPIGTRYWTDIVDTSLRYCQVSLFVLAAFEITLQWK